MTCTPQFSVVIPTRNRPELFKLALNSVLAQHFDAFEVVVVNDGSTPDFLDRYRELEAASPAHVSWHYLVHRPNGRGQSYSMNYGVAQSRGSFVCFLDDDDYWTDPRHLRRASDTIRGSDRLVDLYLTNQQDYFPDGSRQTEPVWIETVPEVADLPAPTRPAATGSGQPPGQCRGAAQVQGFRASQLQHLPQGTV